MCEFKFLCGLSVVVDAVDVPEQLVDGALLQLGLVVHRWLVGGGQRLH